MLAEPPLPEGGAPGRCSVALIRGLRAHGVHVEVLAARQPFSVAGDPPPDLGVEVVTVDPSEVPPTSFAHRLRRPHDDLARSPFQDRVRERAREVDVVHVEAVEAAWCAVGLPVPSVVHLHYRARLDRSVGPPWRPAFREVLRFARRERVVIRSQRWLIASSPRVAETLRHDSPRAEVTLAPLGLDPAGYEPAPLDGPPTVGIIGTAAWPPTASAMRRLVQRVWALVRREVADARLVIAGRGTQSLAFAGPGIELRGPVTSSAAFLRELSVLTYPLDRGSGVKVKVLEALATGLPVVTTACGAEGLEAPGGLLVLPDDDHALAAATVEVLVDAAARRERGAAARRAFDQRYTPERSTAALPGLYERMAR